MCYVVVLMKCPICICTDKDKNMTGLCDQTSNYSDPYLFRTMVELSKIRIPKPLRFSLSHLTRLEDIQENIGNKEADQFIITDWRPFDSFQLTSLVCW